MKKRRLLTAMLALWFGLPSFAEVYEGTCGENVRYSLDTETGVLALTGEGIISSSTYTVPLPWDAHKKSIKKIEADEGIEFPQFDWLAGCESIVEPQYNKTTFIYLPRNYRSSSYNYGAPAGIKVIAPYAFSKCQKVWNIYINAGCEVIGKNAFSACPDLEDVHLPSTVKEIGENAFYNCKMLRKLNMPEGVESVGANCFRYCNALTGGVYNEDCFFYLSEEVTGDFTIPGSPKKIAPNAFAYGKISTLKIPESVKEIGKMAFYYNTGLQRVEMPSSLEVLGDNAFTGCQALEEAAIPESVHKIGDNMFGGCSVLKKVTLPEMLDSIGQYAFQYCTGLEEIQLPSRLTYIGSSAFLGCSGLKTVNIPESLVRMDIPVFIECGNLTSPLYNSTLFVCLPTSYQGEYTVPDGIKAVAGGAFSSCNQLTAVNLPASVEKLGYAVFEQCTSLERVNLPEGITSILNYTFSGCSKLQGVSLPSHLTHIGDGAFSRCASIQEVEIPSTVNYIGGYAFSGCAALYKVVLPEEVDTLGNAIFANCDNLDMPLAIGNTFLKCPRSAGRFEVPEGTEYISDYAFHNCEVLEYVQLPQSVKAIGAYAFANCASLTEITLPEAVDTIGQHAFEMCWSLGGVSVPEGVRYIEAYTFANCAKLHSVELPASLVKIGDYAFNQCTSLENIVLPESLTELKYCAFQGCLSLPSITIPEGIKALESSMFKNCTRLESVTLPEGLTQIGSNAFEGCTALAHVDIPDMVASIGSSAFQGCTMLSEMALPHNLTTLESNLFRGCTNLKRVTIPAATGSVRNEAFYDCTALAYIDVESGNQAYASCSGMLCDKDLTETVVIPPCLTDLVIPATLAGYWQYNLPDCKYLRSATLYYVGGSRATISKEDDILGAMFAEYGDGLPTETETGSDGKKWTIYKREYKLPETLEKLVFYCDSLSMDQFVYTEVNESKRTKSVYLTGNLDLIDTLLVYVDTITDTKLFNQFTNLKVLEAKRVENLANGSFTGMESLEKLTLPQVKTMEEGCLADLKGLKELTLPFAGAGSASTATNFGTLFNGMADDSKKKVVQFMEDGSSETYYLPAGLEKLTLSEGCETLAFGTFYNCNMLHELTLPSTLYMVGEKALYGCAGLTDIYCKGADPSSAYSNTFEGVRVNSCKLHVPHGAGEMYKRSTGWKDFYYIEEEAPITVAVAKNIENAGVIYGMNEYQLGETAELKAVAHSGYVFSAWTEDGQVVSEEETYSFVVEGSRSLIAVFVPVSGSNSVETEAGSTSVAFTWEAEEGASCYQLNVYRDEAMTQLAGSLWFDAEGNPVKKRSTMLSATIDGLEASTGYYYRMTAYNEADQAISQYTGTFETKDANAISETLQDDVVSVRARSGGIVVEGAVGKVVMVFTLSGKMAVQKKAENQTEEITLERGFYIVKVGNGSYKTVVK